MLCVSLIFNVLPNCISALFLQFVFGVLRLGYLFLISTNCSWCKFSQKKTWDVPPSCSKKKILSITFGAIKRYWSHTGRMKYFTWYNWCFFFQMLCLFDVILRVPCLYIELISHLVILWMMFESMMYLNFRNWACLTVHY